MSDIELGEKGRGIREAGYFHLQPEGYWMFHAYSLDKVLNSLNLELNNGNIDGFLRLNKSSANRITSYWQAIAEFFIRAKAQEYLKPQEVGIDGRVYFRYPYQDLDGKVDLTCAIFGPTHAPTIQFMRQIITDDGFREDKVRIDTLAEEEGQIYNPGTWFSMHTESRCTIPPDDSLHLTEIVNHKGGLLESITRVLYSGKESRLTGIDVYGFGKPFVEVRQRGSKRSEYLIPREQFSQHFPKNLR